MIVETPFLKVVESESGQFFDGDLPLYASEYTSLVDLYAGYSKYRRIPGITRITSHSRANAHPVLNNAHPVEKRKIVIQIGPSREIPPTREQFHIGLPFFITNPETTILECPFIMQNLTLSSDGLRIVLNLPLFGNNFDSLMVYMKFQHTKIRVGFEQRAYFLYVTALALGDHTVARWTCRLIGRQLARLATLHKQRDDLELICSYLNMFQTGPRFRRVGSYQLEINGSRIHLVKNWYKFSLVERIIYFLLVNPRRLKPIHNPEYYYHYR